MRNHRGLFFSLDVEILALYIPTMNFRDQMNAEINEADLWFKRAQQPPAATEEP